MIEHRNGINMTLKSKHYIIRNLIVMKNYEKKFYN